MSDDMLLDFAEDDRLAGFRLKKLEVYNWGTFHNRVWSFPLENRNALLTGEIGSGKSTLVDAVTTLLVPANRVAYNKAAGAARKERDLRSYVLGYYKSERTEAGFGTKPVALRDRNSFSVILGVFHNEGYGQTITLAQVFWQKEVQGQPSRFYMVSEREFSILRDFSDFGKDIQQLRKRLRKTAKTEIFDSFPSYGAAFRRRVGLQSEQALELFHQTVSMKSVGNLTEFVRRHMLEAFPVEQRLSDLLSHFDNLNAAHESILKAKAQIERLKPLVEDLDKHEISEQKRKEWREAREGLRAYFAHLKSDLLDKRIGNLRSEVERYRARQTSEEEREQELRIQRDDLKKAIGENGGDRLEHLKKECRQLDSEQARRKSRAEDYRKICDQLKLPPAESPETFVENRQSADRSFSEIAQRSNLIQNRRSEIEFDFKTLKNTHEELTGEIKSLTHRKTNIPSRQIELRQRLCRDLGYEERRFPFIGELIAVREEEAVWEGAAERLLRNFGLSLLVDEKDYKAVSEWVDQTRLKGRLVYYRIKTDLEEAVFNPEPETLPHKLKVKEGSRFTAWIQRNLLQRFDHLCCESLEDFRRSQRAITRNGQIKGSKIRHEKDDRHALTDRSRYILGWRNEAKIHALRKEAADKEKALQELAGEISRLQKEAVEEEKKKEFLYRLKSLENYSEIDWKPLTLEIDRMEREILELEKTSDLLKTLNERLGKVEQEIRELVRGLDAIKDAISRRSEKIHTAESDLSALQQLAESSTLSFKMLSEQIDPLRKQALGEKKLTVEGCDTRQQELREWIQAKIDTEEKRVKTLYEKIIRAMQDFRRDYPSETREMEAYIESGEEYRNFLGKLHNDDLPRFEEKFKKLLNENTLREIANFQAQLNKESDQIRERITRINRSLSEIDFNRDRFIQVEPIAAADSEIKSFRQDLRACTEGTFTGSGDSQYAESKFLQVKAIINRFKGREGSSEVDRRWTEKVTDVRNWFSFAASERWREDGSEYEHYTDSGGKSGGQKEKLAYTVLAASLAYQFGLEWGETRSRSFRFVVIDEAFGRGSDDSARYGLELFARLNLQLLIVTPLQKIHVIEPYVSSVGFIHNSEGRNSLLRCLTLEEYRAEKKDREK